MKVLLDTHAFIWSNTEPARLSPAARGIIEDGETDLYLSAASAWEISIKYAQGKLDLPQPAHPYVISRMAQNSIWPLAVELPHALRAGELPHFHRDPFDRLLIAQAQMENLPILTADRHFARYNVEVIW